MSQHQITISASDGVWQTLTPATVIVTVIDENDNYPVFTQPAYQAVLLENSPPRTLSLSISATDLDTDSDNGDITSYAIQEDDVPFEIEVSVNGKAIVTNSRALDYETDQHVFVFHVHAYDSGGLRSILPALSSSQY